MDSLRAVGSQDAPVLAHAPRNGQARLVPHGFGEGELHSLGFVSGLVAELDECHQHGQAQAPDQNVEDPSHITEAEGL